MAEKDTAGAGGAENFKHFCIGSRRAPTVTGDGIAGAMGGLRIWPEASSPAFNPPRKKVDLSSRKGGRARGARITD